MTLNYRSLTVAELDRLAYLDDAEAKAELESRQLVTREQLRERDGSGDGVQRPLDWSGRP